MVNQSRTAKRINDFIQAKMKEKHMDSISPVEATHWLVEEGLREKIESRRGSYLRQLCRKGKIIGAEQVSKRWVIKKK